MDQDILVPYYEEHKIIKKGKKKEARKNHSKINVEATLDINLLLNQYGEEVHRRAVAEIQLRNIQKREVVDVLDAPFKEVDE